MEDIQVLLQRYQHKLIILKNTLEEMSTTTKQDIIVYTHLEEDIDKLEILIKELQK